MLSLDDHICDLVIITIAIIIVITTPLQSGASSRAKIGGAYFSDVTGSIQDPIAVPGPCEVTEF